MSCLLGDVRACVLACLLACLLACVRACVYACLDLVHVFFYIQTAFWHPNKINNCWNKLTWTKKHTYYKFICLANQCICMSGCVEGMCVCVCVCVYLYVCLWERMCVYMRMCSCACGGEWERERERASQTREPLECIQDIYDRHLFYRLARCLRWYQSVHILRPLLPVGVSILRCRCTIYSRVNAIFIELIGQHYIK